MYAKLAVFSSGGRAAVCRCRRAGACRCRDNSGSICMPCTRLCASIPCLCREHSAFKDLDNLDSKTLTKVCKILGILLDNAKEAAYESKDKLVVIDLYKEEDNIIIYIENSINEDSGMDVNRMKIKGFSTKGKNRGYGLYIVNKLLKESNKILLDQSVKDGKFISIMTIKNN